MYYIDYHIRKITGLSAPLLANRFMVILHGFFAQEANSEQYAIALPSYGNGSPGMHGDPWRAIRIFTQDPLGLSRLADHLQGSPFVVDNLRMGFPREVPMDFNGPYVMYSRYRIPSRRNRQGQGLRLARMAYAKAHRLPYFMLHSASTDQFFSMHVEPIQMDLPGEWCPDSFGLAVQGRRFALPHIPYLG